MVIFLSIVSIAAASGLPSPAKTKNILVINSYHQGYAWTDSLTCGIIKEFRKHPETTLYIENLNSKRFCKTQFKIVRQYFRNKYAGIKFDGVLVTDNDALDFSFQYDHELFPNVPVVFAGITNPDDYSLEGTDYYGFMESGNNGIYVNLIKKLFPETKKLLAIADQTTTGNIYREDLEKQQARFADLSIQFPKDIDVDSICSMVASNVGFDAIFYIGINRDKHGNLVDEALLLERIGKLARVPVFSNDPLSLGKGVIGGLCQSGSTQGAEAAKLLARLIHSKAREGISHVYSTDQECFFDRKELDRFGVSVKKLPKESLIMNQKSIFSKSNFEVLVVVLIGLSFVVVFLSVVNRRRKNEQQRSAMQLLKIETQKKELEGAYTELSGVISELESVNERLSETNKNLEEAKKKAEESDTLKSAFLANVSHEIRTPLNSIVGFSSLLSEPDLDDQTKKIYADLVESNTESLLVLIDEIIDLSKIEAQQLSLKKQDFSVDVLLDELSLIFVQGNHNDKVEICVSRGTNGKELFAFSDRVRVKQIFINLLSNALKFTDEGTIEMGYFCSEGRKIVLYVKDTGIGIGQEHHQVIFHRFRKVNENRGKVYRGTGLGLAITQKLVELLGGKIWLESEPEKGSAFYFTLHNLTMKEVLA